MEKEKKTPEKTFPESFCFVPPKKKESLSKGNVFSYKVSRKEKYP